MYNPDYIDDRACREARRIEREVADDLAWMVQKETQATRELSERMRYISQRMNQHTPKYNYTLAVNNPAHINVLAELSSYKQSTFKGRL